MPEAKDIASKCSMGGGGGVGKQMEYMYEYMHVHVCMNFYPTKCLAVGLDVSAWSPNVFTTAYVSV